MDRARWIKAVSRCMKRDWCIDTADAGLEERDLDSHWRSGDDPAEFVAWFAEKYDLIRFEPLPVRRSLSTPRRSA
jgi:hypothetical protein